MILTELNLLPSIFCILNESKRFCKVENLDVSYTFPRGKVYFRLPVITNEMIMINLIISLDLLIDYFCTITVNTTN